MKKFTDKEKLKYYKEQNQRLLKALDQAYSDILHILNEGQFKNGITWDAKYIIDAMPKRRRKKSF